MTSTFLLAAVDLPADYGKAAPVGLFVIMALGIVVFFLARSMIKHVRRVPASFSREGDGSGPEPVGTAKDPATPDPSPVIPKQVD